MFLLKISQLQEYNLIVVKKIRIPMDNTWVSYVGSRFGNNILTYKQVFLIFSQLNDLIKRLCSHLIFLRFVKNLKDTLII